MSETDNSNSIGRQGLWYLFIGGASALIEFVLFQVLYSLFDVGVAPANIIAVVVATVFNFLMNRNVTFKSTSNPVRSLVLYLLLFAANLALSTWAIAAMIGVGVHSAVAKIITQVAIATWNFFIYRKFIFR